MRPSSATANVTPCRSGRGSTEEHFAFMFEFIHDISAWLEAILTAISSNFWLSLLFIFLVCIGEAVFIVADALRGGDGNITVTLRL